MTRKLEEDPTNGSQFSVWAGKRQCTVWPLSKYNVKVFDKIIKAGDAILKLCSDFVDLQVYDVIQES